MRVLFSSQETQKASSSKSLFFQFWKENEKRKQPAFGRWRRRREFWICIRVWCDLWRPRPLPRALGIKVNLHRVGKVICRSLCRSLLFVLSSFRMLCKLSSKTAESADFRGTYILHQQRPPWRSHEWKSFNICARSGNEMPFTSQQAFDDIEWTRGLPEPPRRRLGWRWWCCFARRRSSREVYAF